MSAADKRIADIRIGLRFRRELGNLDGLARSIQEHGLLHPVIVDHEGNLIAGLRRLHACQSLGWDEMPVRVVDLKDPLRAMNDENVVRKAWLPTEAVAVGRAIEAYEREAARKRQGTRADLHRGNLPPSSSGKSRDRIATTVGMSGRTWQKAKAIVEAGEREPEKYGSLAAEMDQKSRVSGVYRKLVGEPFFLCV